ncbi:unnamed protein product [Lactuca saligna]|uniref:non-specific serine/threonine protein kinase n=1 Tax=Lactuca saligna TaxID=75948 RepID=A0AA36DZ36_LACSI|nr:unnamed protein product [Lactuca saligna]
MPEKIGTLSVDKMEESKKKEDEIEIRGCWIKFRFLGRCISTRSKVENSICGNSIPYVESKSTNNKILDRPVVLPTLSTTTSNTESTPSTPNATEDLKIASQLRKFNFNELKSATRSFRPESLLGEGGFGCVFKGWINENGTTPVKPGTGLSVAVKTLNHDGLQGHKEWLAEVNFLGDLLHPNLVKLIGYCIEDDQRLLVYEFMPRGSLENHLFRRSLPLPWGTRMKIALGAAKGLAFLHEEAERPVIYRDFKTSNILLDADYNAKLSDFGLAKDGPEGDKTHVSTRVMGTYGYAAPEYVMTGHLTSKSDVYSFGVVLLEMITGRRSMDKNRPTGEHNLVEWARPYLGERRRFYQLMDPLLEGRFSVRGAQKAAQLAALCLNRDPKARPLMSDVYEVLKPLVNLKDMACSSPYFQAVHMGGSQGGGSGGGGFKGQAIRGLSIPGCPYVSPHRRGGDQLCRSPKPSCATGKPPRTTGTSPLPPPIYPLTIADQLTNHNPFLPPSLWSNPSKQEDEISEAAISTHRHRLCLLVSPLLMKVRPPLYTPSSRLKITTKHHSHSISPLISTRTQPKTRPKEPPTTIAGNRCCGTPPPIAAVSADPLQPVSSPLATCVRPILHCERIVFLFDQSRGSITVVSYLQPEFCRKMALSSSSISYQSRASLLMDL